MRLIAWNLNHRARPRRIPPWAVPALHAQHPDLVVLTEYVEGPGHGAFLDDLTTIGLANALWTPHVEGQNQVLIASRAPLRKGSLEAPPISPAVPPNLLHVCTDGPLDVIGFRMPAFKAKEQPAKRRVWEWLIQATAVFHARPAVLLGDFNTAPGDSRAYCGDCLEALVASAWRHVEPPSGYSWRHARSGTERRIDHAFVAGRLRARAEYSWEFRGLAGTDATTVGVPDHAMLLLRASG